MCVNVGICILMWIRCKTIHRDVVKLVVKLGKNTGGLTSSVFFFYSSGGSTCEKVGKHICYVNKPNEE